MRIIDDIKLDFSDVLIQPKRSESASRSHINLERTYRFKNGKVGWKGVPLVAANMYATGTMAMARVMAGLGMMTCLHKHYAEDAIIQFFKDVNVQRNVFYTMGIGDEDFEKYKRIFRTIGSVGIINFVCVDVANGYSKYFVDFIKRVKDFTPCTTIMAGNVVTSEMVSELLISGGVDIVKIGIGSGSVCTTRVMSGVGFPQLSAVIECADTAHGLGGHICSDGGCADPGDVAKAFAAGADFVMLGGMLAGHDECEGEWVDRIDAIPGRLPQILRTRQAFKFFGMSSKEAADKFSGGLKEYRAAEGKAVTVPYRGAVKETLQQITGGLRSACTYTGAQSLKDLPKCTTFIRVNRTHNNCFGDKS